MRGPPGVMTAAPEPLISDASTQAALTKPRQSPTTASKLLACVDLERHEEAVPSEGRLLILSLGCAT